MGCYRYHVPVASWKHLSGRGQCQDVDSEWLGSMAKSCRGLKQDYWYLSIDALGSLWYRLDLAVKWRYERNHRFVISFSSEMINSDGQSFWEIVITCSAFSSMGEVEGDYASFWKCRERKDLHAYILVTYFGQFPCMDFCQKWHVVFMSWCCDFEDLANTESLVRMWWFCSTEVHSYTSKSIAACQANFGGGAS